MNIRIKELREDTDRKQTEVLFQGKLQLFSL